MKKPKLPIIPERQIQNAILDWLALNNIFAWEVKTTGTFDATSGRFRRTSQRYMRGVADILGIYEGKPLAIEVKSAKGVLSEFQKVFLKRFQDNGGIAILARSVQDVEKALNCLRL